MPYAITTFGTGTGFARHLVGAREEFTVLAVSCVFAALSHNPPYGYPSIEWRDATDGLIYRQTLNTLLNGYVGLAGAAEGEPWYVSNNGPFGFPQANEQQDNATMSVRIPKITLTPGCTFGIYVATFAQNRNFNPDTALSTHFDVESPHLWVEDTLESKFRQLPPPELVGPYALVPGPNA